jgi:hypothetical protein
MARKYPPIWAAGTDLAGPLTAGGNGGSARSAAFQRGIQLLAAGAWGTSAPVWSRHELSGTGDRPSTSLSGMKWLFAVLVPLAVCAGGSHNEARRATMGPTAAWAR